MAVGMSATTRDSSSHLIDPTLILMLASKPLSLTVKALRVAASAPPLVPALDPNLLRWDQNSRSGPRVGPTNELAGETSFDESPHPTPQSRARVRFLDVLIAFDGM